MNPADNRASEPDGLDPQRVVQVITTQHAGARKLGSGYRVSGDAVLTAAHVLSDAVSVQLRFLTEDGSTRELPGEQVWADSALDIAVLKIAKEASTGGWCAAEVPPVQFAEITRSLDCEALGFPRFMLRPDTASPNRDTPTRFRDSHHARGRTTPWTNMRGGGLEISMDPPGSGPEPHRSPWEGMSGAAVWSGGYVIGVVSEHHLTDGLGRLTASRVQRWYRRLTPAQINELNELIGLPAHTDQLTQIPPPSPLPDTSEPDTSEPDNTSEPDDAPEVQEATRKLADDVHKQWNREARRRVSDPFTLAVRFGCTDRNVFDHWANICQAPPGTAPEPLPLDGQLDGILEVYESVPSRRLVVLGEAGAGKTILTLRFVLDRLSSRAPGDRVPVIFALGSWDPTSTSLDDWLCGQLVRDHPFLETPAGHGGSLADALLDKDKILPVLDGFDEIASGLHGAALRALNLTTTPLLLTSRPAEYSQAVDETRLLTAAAVIELEDLTVDSYADYLHRAGRPVRNSGEDSSAWKPVLAELGEEPRSPGAANLAKVLTTPLMVSLAGTVYRGAPGHDPSELLKTTRFASPEALEAHLLAGFVPAVYDPTPTGGGTGDLRRWKPERAERWLSYLAAHLDELGTHDLAWWKLGTTMRRSSRMLVVGFLAALAFGVTTAIGNVPVDLVATEKGPGFAIARGLIVGLLHGLVVGLVFGLAYGYVSRTAPREPSRVRVQIFGRTGRTRATFVSRFLIGLGLGFPAAIVLVLLDRYVVGAVGFDDGLDGGAMGALLFPLEVGLGTGFVLVLMAWLEAPIDIRRAVSAWDLLSTNRKNVVFHMLVWMLVFGLPAGLAIGFGFALPDGPGIRQVSEPVRGLLAGLVFGLEAAFGGGLGYGLSFTAWGQWVALSRVWLPLTGRLPWAVIAFLDDAHQRGVLRRAGTVYQFRHAQLQDHLAQFFHAHHTFHRSNSAGTAVPEPSATRTTCHSGISPPSGIDGKRSEPSNGGGT